jgi:uncharacterized protein (TIGR01777 family)
MKILVTGATGFVGKKIVEKLLKENHQVVILSRNSVKAALTLGGHCEYHLWSDFHTPPPVEAFQGVEGIIHLMGEGIADKRWNEEQKKKIYDSRILSTRSLMETLKGLKQRPRVLVSASAVGIYGNRGDEEITENSSLASDFLATVCRDWETEALKAQSLGLRVALIRTGVVLGQDGGALKKMLPIFKLGGGGPVGSGSQYMSWIHVSDLADMYIEAVKNQEISGVFNGTAPHPSTSKDFARALGKTLHRPAFAPAPAFALKLVFGEMSQVLLDGQKVLPKKFEEKRFSFSYPTLEAALKASVL